jgi:hypothetical protein
MDRDLKRARTLISLVHDGQLTDEEYRFLEKAVLRYPELKLEIYRHERLHDLLGMIPSVSAPAGIEDGVLSAIRSEGPVRRASRVIFFPGRRFPVEAVGAIAASIIVLFVVLITLPSVLNKDAKTASPGMVGAPTASVALDEASPPIAGETMPSSAEDVALAGPAAGDVAPTDTPAEDVALADTAVEDKHNDHPLTEGGREKALFAADIEKRTFSSELPPAGVLTAAGLNTEKVSKPYVPARVPPYSAAKKEEPRPMGSTTYVYCPSDESPPPTVLLIYNNDPSKTKKDIMDKAVSLGGTVATTETKGGKDKDDNSGDLKIRTEESEAAGDAVSLPPDKMGELLDYLAARYPETNEVIEDLRTRKTMLFLRIDVVPTIQ